jgi:dethiobiotin synthetase
VRDLLITGTDTGVGKTVIAAATVMVLRANGIRAIGFKPAETGITDGEESDSSILTRASGERNQLASPLLQLHEGLAPAVAADRAGVVLRASDIESRIEALRREGYSLVIEGAGGVLVPLSWDPRCYTVIDLAERFGLEAVVVGRAGLGTLNHVAMTVAMLRSRSVSIKGIILNGRSSVHDVAETTNPSVLARMLPGIAILEVPHCQNSDVIRSAVPIVRNLF